MIVLQILVRIISGDRSLFQRMDTASFVSSSATIGDVLADDTREFAALLQLAATLAFLQQSLRSRTIPQSSAHVAIEVTPAPARRRSAQRELAASSRKYPGSDQSWWSESQSDSAAPLALLRV